MCEVIHVLSHNKSIWLCDTNVAECPKKRSAAQMNSTNSSSVNVSSWQNSSTPTNNSTGEANISVQTLDKRTSNITKMSNITQSTINNQTEGNETSPSSSLDTFGEGDETSPSSSLDTLGDTTQRVSVYLRPLHSNISQKSNMSNTSHTSNECVCDTSQWLHILWALPVFTIVFLFFYYKCNQKRHKISNLFIPKKNRKLVRAASWPQHFRKKEVNIVPASEPGDVSSRGVFLTGIL